MKKRRELQRILNKTKYVEHKSTYIVLKIIVVIKTTKNHDFFKNSEKETLKRKTKVINFLCSMLVSAQAIEM